jgi:quercetin dioxygenase-like cupin family protein
MFVSAQEPAWRPLLEKVRQRTLAYGHQTLLAEFALEAGARLPLHQHPQEQTGYLVRGRLALTIAGETRELGPGDSWCVPADAPHQALALEECLAIEVFSPLRSDYLPDPHRS